jgi:pimeloyl-ACP methyl ester carboxylesterase
MTFVLVHGGGHSARCWEPTIPHLDGPAVAIDLPGRGARPGPLDELRIGDMIASAVRDLEALDTDDVVLVGHSMAGLVMPGIMEHCRDRIRHAVFVSCAILEPGTSLLDLLPDDIRAMAVAAPPSAAGAARPPEDVVRFQCYDMDEAQTRFTLAVVVPEAYWPTREPADLTGLQTPIPRTWVKLLRDRTFSPAVQDEMAARARCDRTIEIDSGHTVMISHPGDLAAALNQIRQG